MSGQQVVRAVGGPLGHVLAAFGQDGLSSIEQALLDKGWMGALGPCAAEVHLAQVGAVPQDDQDRLVGPRLARPGGEPGVTKPVGDGVGAEALVGIEVEDDWDQRGFGGGSSSDDGRDNITRSERRTPASPMHEKEGTE
jgi:hypothetical protein